MKRTSGKTLKLVGLVGANRSNPEAWARYHRVVGDACCRSSTPVETETAAFSITAAGCKPTRSRSAGRPFFGLQARNRRSAGHVLEGACEGNLVIADPTRARRVQSTMNDKRFEETYLELPQEYFTGDGGRRDGDGDHLDHRPGRRRHQRLRRSHGHGGGRKCLSLHMRASRSAVVGDPHTSRARRYPTPNATSMAGKTRRTRCARSWWPTSQGTA